MSLSSPVPEYVVVGHVTRDLLPDGGYTLGGTATFAALAATRLGLAVGMLTSGGPEVEQLAGEGLRVQCCPAGETTVFENIYLGHRRLQYIRGLACTIHPEDVPDLWRLAPIVHLGPIAQEVDTALVAAFPGALLGITPQGWLRSWDQQGLVSPAVWTESTRVLEAADLVVLSLDDLGGDRDLLQTYIDRSRLLVLTMGDQGAIVHRKGSAQRVPAYAVQEVDPTGAGDVFAAGYLIRYAETGDPIEAARYANCVASFVVEGPGATCLPTREQVEDRLAHGRLVD